MAGGRDRLDHQGRRALAPDGIKGVVGAEATRQFQHRLADVLALGVDAMGGAELARQLELVVEQVTGDDGLGTGELCPLHDVEADAAAANYQYRGAGFNVGMTDDGADAGGDAAADNGSMRPR